MDVFKIAVKLFAADDAFEPSEFVAVFHRWIQTQAVDSHLLIDVADYAHVPDGPGTVLVSGEANFYMDRGNGRLGLLYARKQPFPGTFRDRLRATVLESLKAAARLEQEPGLAGRLKFKTDEALLRFDDRLRAPNTPDTFEAMKPDVTAVAGELFPGETAPLRPAETSPDKLLEIPLKASAPASLETLIGRLARLEPAAK